MRVAEFIVGLGPPALASASRPDRRASTLRLIHMLRRLRSSRCVASAGVVACLSALVGAAPPPAPGTARAARPRPGRVPPAHNGYNMFETPLTTGNVSQLGRKWAVATPGMVDSSPAVAKGIVYVGTDGGAVLALKASTGKTLWTVRPGGAVYSSPAVSHGVVYVSVAGQNGGLFALNATTGRKLWRFAHGATSSSPSVANGVVYISAGPLYAVNATTGKQIWSFCCGVSTSPAVANGMVYIGSMDLTAVDAATGHEVWSFQTQGTQDGGCMLNGPSPAAANG